MVFIFKYKLLIWTTPRVVYIWYGTRRAVKLWLAPLKSHWFRFTKICNMRFANCGWSKTLILFPQLQLYWWMFLEQEQSSLSREKAHTTLTMSVDSEGASSRRNDSLSMPPWCNALILDALEKGTQKQAVRTNSASTALVEPETAKHSQGSGESGTFKYAIWNLVFETKRRSWRLTTTFLHLFAFPIKCWLSRRETFPQL